MPNCIAKFKVRCKYTTSHFEQVYHACLVNFSRLMISPLVSMDVKRGSRHFFQGGGSEPVTLNFNIKAKKKKQNKGDFLLK